MAELALAIIPLGITVTSGLVKYLKNFNDHDDDRARLVLQAERFRKTFQSLDVVLKRSQLNPEVYSSASEASNCLKECQDALNELDTLQQNIFSAKAINVVTVPHVRTKDKIKDGCKKLLYPLRKSDVESLEGALDKLSTTLSLALEMLHLDEEYLTRNLLNQQTIEIQKTAVISFDTSATVKELHQPISRMESTLPVLQASVDAVIPHFDQRMEQISCQQLQMAAQIRTVLDMAGAMRQQDRLGTNQQLPYNDSGGSYLAARQSNPEQSTLAKRTDPVTRCSCHLQRRRKSKWFALGPVFLAEEMLHDFCHEKDCDFYIPMTGYEKIRTIRFAGLISLFGKGIEVSFSHRTRAGGYSISPSFTYFPVVNRYVAPAFSVISLLFDTWELGYFDKTKSKAILIAAQRKLHELFCSGRASPDDVDEDGDTLLHSLSFLIWEWSRILQEANSPFVRVTCEGLVNFLVTAGASVTRRDKRGNLALHYAIDSTFLPASIYGQLNAGNDIEDRSTSKAGILPNKSEFIDYYSYNQSIARIQYGPLGLAIIQNNLLEVNRLLSLHPHMVEEESFYGETTLHIAIHRPDILETLAKKANPTLWITYDNSYATVLSLAIRPSDEICNPGETLDAASCPCTLPLRIILAAGCPIIPHRDFRRGPYLYRAESPFTESSSHCKTILAHELRSRRRQLRDLARDKLSITELTKFANLEEIPDIDAIGMDKLLRQKGILSLGALSTFVEEDLPNPPCQDVGYYSRSIFFDLETPGDADLFVDSGFKVICSDQDHDSSLDRALLESCYPLECYASLDYAIWLFDHQAPLWKWSYRFTSPMPSIFVLADILGMQVYKHPNQDKTSDRAEAYLSESALVDNCSCLCSPGGCTPFTSRMKWLALPHDQVEDIMLQDYATRFGSHVEVHGRNLNLRHHVIMVRQATFSALGLRHTCVDRPGCSRFPGKRYSMYGLDPVTELEPDEIEFEILNINVEARNQLEDVVVMFQDFVLNGRQTTIPNKSDSSDVICTEPDESGTLFVDEYYQQRILDFWKHIWVKRMQEALDAVDKGWEDKSGGHDDYVQVSICEEAVSETETEDSLEDDDAILNRIIQRIQDI